MDNRFDILGGNNMIAPNATQVVQNIYYANTNDVEARHSSDERTILHLMRYMNVLLMDSYFERGPARIDKKVITIHDAWNEILSSSTFVIYDEELRVRVKEFFTAWHALIAIGSMHYFFSNNGMDFVFGVGGGAEFDAFKNDEEEQCFDELLKRWHPLFLLFTSMMDCIKQRYVIDFSDVVVK